MLPVIPGLVRELTGGDIASAAAIYGWLIALYSLMQFLFGPAMGALSDRFGRRPILLSMLGLGLDYLVLAFASNLWVVVARIVGGVMGASIATASAYIADITPPEKRAQNFGSSASPSASASSPARSSAASSASSARACRSSPAALSAFAARLRLLLPAGVAGAREPPAVPARGGQSHRRLHRHRPLSDGAGAHGRLRPVATRRAAPGEHLGAVHRLPLRLGRGAGRHLVRLGRRPLRHHAGRAGPLRRAEARRVARNHFGLTVGAVCLVLIAFVTQWWMLYVVTVPYVLGWGLTGPAAQSVVTRIVPPNEQGILQGAISSVGTATGVVGPPIAARSSAISSARGAVPSPGVAFLHRRRLFLVAPVCRRRRSAARGSRARGPAAVFQSEPLPRRRGPLASRNLGNRSDRRGEGRKKAAIP